VQARRSSIRFSDSWRELFQEKGWTQKHVAVTAGIDPSFFSKALRGEGYKKLSADWIATISEMAGLPRDFYPEVREDAVVEAVRTDPDLRDRLFEELGLDT
jgi:transcriptional regulator with XRE-family HTH domain